MAILHRKRAEVEPVPLPDGVEMTIQEVFWIGAPKDAKLGSAQRRIAAKAPGTVLVGELRGSGILMPGDLVIHDQGRFSISGIEVFRQLLDRAEPPRAVGLRLGTGVERSLFVAGQQVRFERPS